MLTLNIVLAQGAVKCGAVNTNSCIPFMTDKMRARFESRPMPYAIIAAFPYLKGEDDGLPLYCRGGDYVADNKEKLTRASAILSKLYPMYTFTPRGNGWPLPVVQAARLAGLGVIGVNNLLITEEYGSYVTLGAIFTDMPMQPSEPSGYCENCGECARACPGGAIGRFDAMGSHFIKERCVSYITQHVENPDEQQAGWLKASATRYGCDLCQLSCPHNKSK